MYYDSREFKLALAEQKMRERQRNSRAQQKAQEVPMSYSKIIQIGNIVHDLKPKDVNGKACLEFSMATNFKYGDKEDSCFIDVVLWEKAAENVAKFFKKGDPILIEGELRQQRWETREGDKRSKHVIRGHAWGFAGGRREEGGQGQGQASRTAERPASSPQAKPAPAGPELDDDEIPF